MATKKSVPRFNPRGGDRRGPRQMPGRSASSLWYGLVFLLLLGGAQMYFLASPGRSVPHSQFKHLLKSGKVVEVAISEQTIRGTLTEEMGTDTKTKLFTTTRVEDPKLTEELEAKGIKYTGEVTNHWLTDVLGWIIPLVFFI